MSGALEPATANRAENNTAALLTSLGQYEKLTGGPACYNE